MGKSESKTLSLNIGGEEVYTLESRCELSHFDIAKIDYSFQGSLSNSHKLEFINDKGLRLSFYYFDLDEVIDALFPLLPVLKKTKIAFLGNTIKSLVWLSNIKRELLFPEFGCPIRDLELIASLIEDSIYFRIRIEGVSKIEGWTKKNRAILFSSAEGGNFSTEGGDFSSGGGDFSSGGGRQLSGGGRQLSRGGELIFDDEITDKSLWKVIYQNLSVNKVGCIN